MRGRVPPIAQLQLLQLLFPLFLSDAEQGCTASEITVDTTIYSIDFVMTSLDKANEEELVSEPQSYMADGNTKVGTAVQSLDNRYLGLEEVEKSVVVDLAVLD